MSEAFDLQREVTARSIERQPICGYWARLALFAILFGVAGACPAQDAAKKMDTRLQEVVVEAQRQAADEQVTQRVQKALSNDAWIYSEHVTVTTRNGVVTVEGIVQDTGEWFRILDLARKTPGARQVVSNLEMLHNDPDGG